MPVQVSVGPQVLTINHGATFVVSDLQGEIDGDSPQGMFSNDTRYVSSYGLYTNGERCVLLTSGTPTYYLARIYMTNPTFATEDGPVEQGTLEIEIYRPVGVDRQQPHRKDELYVVIAGSGTFVHAGQRTPFHEGDTLFVRAGVPHRFEDFSPDFATWVFFYGPEGGE